MTKRRTFPKATHLYDVLRIFGDNVVTTEGEGACHLCAPGVPCLMYI